MPYIRRWTSYPSITELLEIEAINIVDLIPPGNIVGVGTGVAAFVGQALKGPVNTPTEVTSAQDLISTFGGWSAFSNPGGAAAAPGNPPATYDGNLFLSIRNKAFARLVLVNVQQSVGTCTVTASGTSISPGFTIPAGARVQDASGANIFALLDDVVVLPGLTSATPPGSYVAGTPNTATFTGVRMRRVLGSSASPTADSFVAADATAIAPAGITLDCPLFSTVTDFTESSMDTAYGVAIATLLNDSKPANEASVICSARHRDAIMTGPNSLKQCAIDSSAKGQGRIACIAPPTGTSKATAIGSSAPGVGNYGLSDRAIYCYPGIQTVIPEMPAATITASSTGLIDWPSDASMASILSQIGPEHNPGGPVARGLMGYVLGLESGVTGLTQTDYKNFRAAGIAAPRIDAVTGCQFQSGVTSVNPSAYPSLRNIARRRMADYIQDSLAAGLVSFSKGLNTPAKRRQVRAEIEGFLDGLLSPNNPEAARILAYSVDEVNGNTPALLAQGIFVVLVSVQTISSMDAIEIVCNIGESVTVEAA